MSWLGFVYANIIFGLLTLFLVMGSDTEPNGYGRILTYQIMQMVYCVFLGSIVLMYFSDWLAGCA